MRQLLCLVLLFALSKADDVSPGKCPDYETISNFDVNRFLGVWHEIENYPTLFEKGEKCITFNFTLAEEGSDIPLKLTYTREKGGEVKVNNGDAIFVDKDNGKLKIRFGQLDPRDDYWVLATDYANYSIVSSCHNLAGLLHIQYAWIYAREKVLDEKLLVSLRAKMDAVGLDSTKLQKHEQTCDWKKV